MTRFKLVGVTKLASVKGSENINACIYEAPFIEGYVKARAISWPVTKVECNIDYEPGTFDVFVLGNKYSRSGAFHEQEDDVIELVKSVIRDNL